MSPKKEQLDKLKERLMEGMQALERGDIEAYERSVPPLLPERHPNQDFFVCDILDVAPKDDLGSMEHPMFSLSTKPDHRIRTYEHNGKYLVIAPGAYGLATIWDKDILIYCISQVVEALNRGRKDVSRTVWVTAYDLLAATNRTTSGVGYKRLKMALERLQGTQITTNIRQSEGDEGFGLIDYWKIVKKSPDNDSMVAIEITLSKWLYNAIKGREVLTISRDYFRLRKGIERRLYQLARKHCGLQSSWKIGLDLLHKKSGSGGTLKEFRRKVKAIANTNHLPDYNLAFAKEQDCVKFFRRNKKGHLKHMNDLVQGRLL